jgi:PKD repeat protein
MPNLPSVYLIHGSDAPQHTAKMKEILQELVKENRIKAFKTLESKTEWVLPSDELVDRDLIIVLLTDQIANYHLAGTRGLRDLQAKTKQLKVMEIIVDNVPYDDSFIIAPVSTEPIRASPEIDEIWAGIKKDLLLMFPALVPGRVSPSHDYKKYIKYAAAVVILGLIIFAIAKITGRKPEVSFTYEVRDVTLKEKKEKSDCYQPCIVYFYSKSDTGDSLKWDFGDTLTKATSVKSFPEYTFNQAGDYTIRLTATKGKKSGSFERKITVKPVPFPDFEISYSNKSMAPSDLTFINNSQNASRFLWTFPDGTTSTTKNPLNINFSTPGTFTVTLDAFNSDSIKVSVTKPVTILQEERPVARFSSKYLGLINGKHQVEFTNESVFSDRYVWDFADNTDRSSNGSKTFTHQYDVSKHYIVRLTAYKGEKKDEIDKTIYAGKYYFPNVGSILYEMRKVSTSNSAVFDQELKTSAKKQNMQILLNP